MRSRTSINIPSSSDIRLSPKVAFPVVFQLFTCIISVLLRLGERFVDHSRKDRLKTRVRTNSTRFDSTWNSFRNCSDFTSLHSEFLFTSLRFLVDFTSPVTSVSLRCQFDFQKYGFGKVRYTGALGEHTTSDATIKNKIETSTTQRTTNADASTSTHLLLIPRRQPKLEPSLWRLCTLKYTR